MYCSLTHKKGTVVLFRRTVRMKQSGPGNNRPFCQQWLTGNAQGSAAAMFRSFTLSDFGSDRITVESLEYVSQHTLLVKIPGINSRCFLQH